VLTSEYQPEKPVGRGSKVQEIADSLRPLNDRVEAVNLLVFGPAGTGKSTCLNHVFDHLDSETGIKPVTINCWQYNTRSSLLTQLLIELGYPAPRKGKPVDELITKIKEWADKSQSLNAPKGYAVALDEFDQLAQKSEIIYDLKQLNSEVESKFGLVMLSNQQPSQIHLEHRSRSRIQVKTVEFQPYTVDQLIEILRDRAESAFYPGTVDEDVLRKVAATVAQDGGDCRQALHLLRQAGLEAEQDGKKQVTDEIVENVINSSP